MSRSIGGSDHRAPFGPAEGDVCARYRLVPLVYEEPRRQARRYLSRERSDITLQTTALIHGASLRFARSARGSCSGNGGAGLGSGAGVVVPRDWEKVSVSCRPS